MASELETKIEAIDGVVKTFSDALKEFVKTTNENVRTVQTNVTALGECWTGSLYDSFKRKMDAQTASITGSVKRGEELQKKLDEISAEFAAALKLLRESGNS